MHVLLWRTAYDLTRVLLFAQGRRRITTQKMDTKYDVLVSTWSLQLMLCTQCYVDASVFIHNVILSETYNCHFGNNVIYILAFSCQWSKSNFGYGADDLNWSISMYGTTYGGH